MKIYPKRKSDEEYFKEISHSYDKRWRTFFICIIISLIAFFATYYFMNKFDHKIKNLFESMKLEDSSENKKHNENIQKVEYVWGVRLGLVHSIN